MTCMEAHSRILASAAARSPASRSNISPGTASQASISCLRPSRITAAWGADSRFRLSKDFLALTCCAVPRAAFMVTTRKITRVLSPLSVRKEITAAAKRIITSRSWYCFKNIFHGGSSRLSVTRFSPYCLLRRITSFRSRPASEVPRPSNTSSAEH